jgi:DNA-binding beta-propeller fold protein YncE
VSRDGDYRVSAAELFANDGARSLVFLVIFPIKSSRDNPRFGDKGKAEAVVGMGSVKHARMRRGARMRTWIAAVACLLVALVTLSAGQVLASPSAPASSSATPDGVPSPLLVSNVVSGTVSAIGPSWNVTLGVGTDPWGVAFTPDGQYGYVVNGGSGTVSVISDADTSHPEVSQTLTIGTSTVGTGGIAITPDGQYAYVTGYNADTVSVIDDADSSHPVVSSTVLNVGLTPAAIAITPDGQYAYVVGTLGTITVIDGASTADPTVGPTITLGGNGLTSIAITPNGQYAYVTNSSNSNYTGYNVAVIGGVETPDPALAATLTVGDFPTDVAITPDGKYAYVTDAEAVNSFNPNTGAYTVIDGASSGSPTVGQTVTANGGGEGSGDGIAVSPDGQSAYLINIGLKTVSLLTGADTGSPVESATSWPVGDFPGQIAVGPAQPVATGIAAVRFAPLSLPNGNDTPGLPVIDDDVNPVGRDHSWGPATCPDGLAKPQSYDYLDCTSPPSGTPSKDWPVIYAAGDALTIDQAVFFSPNQLPDPQLTATAVVTNGGQTLASLTLAPVFISSTLVDGNYELSTTKPLDFTGQLPSQPGADQLSITWTIKSGGTSYPQGTSIDPVYVTWQSYHAGDQGFPSAPYVSLLNVGTIAATGQTTQAGVIGAIWNAFATLNVDQSVLDPQTGQVSNGPALTYWENGDNTIGDWWNTAPTCPESVLRLMGRPTNTCGNWANFLAAVMEYQGIPVEPHPLCSSFGLFASCPGFDTGPRPGIFYPATGYSYMLIDPKLWHFGTATGTGGFPFVDSLTVSSAGVNVQGTEVTYTPSTVPIAQGGITTPPDMFRTGDHEIDYIPGWGYADPSYGNPADGTTPYSSIGAYEPTAIAGFAVVYAHEDGSWVALPNTIGSSRLETTCARYQCQFRAVRYPAPGAGA